MERHEQRKGADHCCWECRGKAERRQRAGEKELDVGCNLPTGLQGSSEALLLTSVGLKGIGLELLC